MREEWNHEAMVSVSRLAPAPERSHNVSVHVAAPTCDDAIRELRMSLTPIHDGRDERAPVGATVGVGVEFHACRGGFAVWVCRREGHTWFDFVPVVPVERATRMQVDVRVRSAAGSKVAQPCPSSRRPALDQPAAHNPSDPPAAMCTLT